MRLLAIFVLAALGLFWAAQPGTVPADSPGADIAFGLRPAEGWFFQVDPPIEPCINPVTGKPGLKLSFARSDLSAIKHRSSIVEAEACVTYPFCAAGDTECLLQGDYYLRFLLTGTGPPIRCISYSIKGLRLAAMRVGFSMPPGNPVTWDLLKYTDPGTDALQHLCLWRGMEMHILMMGCPDNTGDGVVSSEDLDNVLDSVGMTEGDRNWEDPLDPNEDEVVTLFGDVFGYQGVTGRVGLDCSVFRVAEIGY